MHIDDIKRGLRAEIKKRENEQYLTFQCNVRQMCKDVLAKLEEQESEIAELKAQKAQAEDDCAYWKMNEGNAANAMHETEEYAMQLYKEAQHNKYKRCLAMTRWCRMHDEFMQLESERLGLPQSTLFLEYRRKAMWWNKWRKRWLELAEKFKETK
jgi:Asp-tRNA(Asn)/Glu-tRNA(Gln) amidotransferase A subunit family amidase